jgi:hypothetical protein
MYTAGRGFRPGGSSDLGTVSHTPMRPMGLPAAEPLGLPAAEQLGLPRPSVTGQIPDLSQKYPEAIPAVSRPEPGGGYPNMR